MGISEKLLDLLFRQVSPERILSQLVEYIGGKGNFLHDLNQYALDNKNIFMDFSESTLNGYSEDEQRLLYERLNQKSASWEEHSMLPGGFLNFLIQYGNEILNISGGEPRCKSEHVLSWRNLYLFLGQDTIVCPYLAYQDYHRGITRTDFTWPAILRTDDNELYKMLEQGIAENHNHLGGSTQSFQITWCYIMNYPQNIRKELKSFLGSRLHRKMSRGKKDNCLDLYEQLELAALIRSILFRSIHREEFEYENHLDEKHLKMKDFSGEAAFYEEYVNAFSLRNQLEDITDCLRYEKGVFLEYPDGKSFCIDYVIDDQLMQKCVNSHIRLLVGERCFLYQCTLECIKENGFTKFEQSLFYLYLVLKTNFRSEMIQTNEQTGFLNFQNYQDRKSDSWDNNPYFWEATWMALNYRLESEPIVSLECRLMPKPLIEKNIDKIYLYDKSKRFADCKSGKTILPSMYNFDKELNLNIFKDNPYFYVFHFPKSVDNRVLKKDQFQMVPYRHQQFRKSIRETAIGLASSLRKSTYLRTRIRGIDGCSNEIGCRPEVFSSVYRYLEDVEKKWNIELDKILPSSSMKLSKTFHVGEDFLDLADGLRAIDEAVEFLRLERGSRIGHALAMGVCPEKHYCLKNYEIITTKQNRLDDLVWMIYRSKELGINIGQPLESRLFDEAYQLFRDLYGKSINERKWNCSLIDYYHSMKLRSDDPSLYDPFFRNEDSFLQDGIKRHEWNQRLNEFDDYLQDNKPYLINYRNDEVVWWLNSYYHFDRNVGILGEERIVCSIDAEYIKLIRQIQDALQKYLSEKGIIIECNPSSNVLIGTFKKYESHPIFRFNNRKINNSGKISNTQMHVCVNTDDLGVFDTSLEFEYALLKHALLNQKDKNGNPIYNSRDIMEYLDELRNMGIGAIF